MAYSIRKLSDADQTAALRVINEAARWYAEVLPADEVLDPEMTPEQWIAESARMTWFGAESGGTLVGVVGLECIDDVALLRHWYVDPAHQRRGVGTMLREHLEAAVVGVDRVIAGTYAANSRARHALEAAGYRLSTDIDEVLSRYYRIPEVRQSSSVTYELALSTASSTPMSGASDRTTGDRARPGATSPPREVVAATTARLVQFPIGYHRFHRNQFLNYQFNRLYSEGFLPYESLEQVARRVRGFEDWRREFAALGEQFDSRDLAASGAVTGEASDAAASAEQRDSATDTVASPTSDSATDTAPTDLPKKSGPVTRAYGREGTYPPTIRHAAGQPRRATGAVQLGPDEARLAAAAFAYRAAEFLAKPQDPRKLEYYERFVDRFDRAFAATGVTRTWVPYQDGALPVLHLPGAPAHPQQPKRGAILVHGGFDSLIEEFVAILQALARAGYDVYAFDGPGQGGALRRHGLRFDHDWEKPTSAVLDHFELSEVALLGISMGGYWCLRAAAFEARISRVIVMASVLDWLEQLPGFLRRPVRSMARYRRFMNASVRLRMRLIPTLAHAISQCLMQIDGDEPVDAVEWLLAMCAKHQHPERVTQDVLLMHGTKDRFQPLSLHHAQRAALTNARSVTERLFTEAEHAASHCQMGNLGLAVDTMLEWLAEHPPTQHPAHIST
jgi:pimeloyl-ACP methyl ester carboxylesterase/RimJ/RimL family protein N-acetyltransferase